MSNYDYRLLSRRNTQNNSHCVVHEFYEGPLIQNWLLFIWRNLTVLNWLFIRYNEMLYNWKGHCSLKPDFQLLISLARQQNFRLRNLEKQIELKNFSPYQ